MNARRLQNIALLAAALLTAIRCPGAGDSTNTNVIVRIFSARVTRGAGEAVKRFTGRSYNDSSPGVSLQLALTLQDGMMMQPARDALTIETFVDDTYQNLATTAGERGGYSDYNQSVLSEDKRSLLLSISSPRSPADDAGRVFVRGSILARVTDDKPITISNRLSLVVGQEVTMGGFPIAVRSVTDHGGGNSVGVTLAVSGDATRVHRIRLLDAAGTSLHDERLGRTSGSEIGERATSVFLTLRSMPKEPVTLEFSYVEKLRTVRIPFEAQVDIGYAKAGPITPAEPSAPKRRTELNWPPPPKEEQASLPQTRPPVDIAAAPSRAAAETATKASIDLFSFAVAKAPQTEVNISKWRHPPSKGFHASGYTVARLMLSTPGATILSVPPEGLAIKQFADDKVGPLDTSTYREGFGSAGPQQLRRSPEGDQALLTLSFASAPTPGATRCTLSGTVQAKVARGEVTNTASNVDMRSGNTFTNGPFTIKIVQVRQIAPLSPGFRDPEQVELWVEFTGPVSRIRSVEILGISDGKEILLNPNRIVLAEMGMTRPDYANHVFKLSSAPVKPPTFRIRHFTTDELVQVPFEISTGIGL
jgi:hypothetical protein